MNSIGALQNWKEDQASGRDVIGTIAFLVSNVCSNSQSFEDLKPFIPYAIDMTSITVPNIQMDAFWSV